MTSESASFTHYLASLLGDRSSKVPHPCIRDLLENGLDLKRFATGDRTPIRQDITQYLAAWSRSAGLTMEETRAWLSDYCVAKLAVLSRRTPAAIRHSTKGNVRYIYQSEVPFVCDCEANPFRARCGPECSVYSEMRAARAARGNQPPPRWVPPRPPVEPIVPWVPVKERNREQFEAATRVIREELQKGTRKNRIVQILNERGLKTRTGRKWSDGILSSELSKMYAANSGPLPVPGITDSIR